MGWYTVVVFNNDNIGAIERDPEAGRKIYNAILQASIRSGIPTPVRVDGGVVGHVIEQAHADTRSIFAMSIDSKYLGHAEWNDRPHYILEKLARQHGFDLHRLPEKYAERSRTESSRENCEDCKREIQRGKEGKRRA